MAGQSQTFLQIVNEVQKRLREATTAAVSTNTYSALLGTFVNQVKAEIEAAYTWHALRDTYTVATTNAASSYALTDSGRGALILSVWDFTNKVQLKRSYRARMDQKYFGETVATGKPTEYLPNGYDANYDLKVQLWPQPVTGDLPSLRVNVYKPQAELSAGTDVPLCPINPLLEGVVARAMAERGEDGGTSADRQEQYYRDILASYVSTEAAHDQTDTDWVPR